MTYQIVNNARRIFEYSPLFVFLFVILMFCCLRFMFYTIYDNNDENFERGAAGFNCNSCRIPDGTCVDNPMGGVVDKPSELCNSCTSCNDVL